MTQPRAVPATRAELARYLDATLLAPDATAGQIAQLCHDAAGVQAAAVCIAPSRLPLPQGLLPGTVALATVCGFPTGAHAAQIKAAEAAW